VWPKGAQRQAKGVRGVHRWRGALIAIEELRSGRLIYYRPHGDVIVIGCGGRRRAGGRFDLPEGVLHGLGILRVWCAVAPSRGHSSRARKAEGNAVALGER